MTYLFPSTESLEQLQVCLGVWSTVWDIWPYHSRQKRLAWGPYARTIRYSTCRSKLIPCRYVCHSHFSASKNSHLNILSFFSQDTPRLPKKNQGCLETQRCFLFIGTTCAVPSPCRGGALQGVVVMVGDHRGFSADDVQSYEKAGCECAVFVVDGVGGSIWLVGSTIALMSTRRHEDHLCLVLQAVSWFLNSRPSGYAWVSSQCLKDKRRRWHPLTFDWMCFPFLWDAPQVTVVAENYGLKTINIIKWYIPMKPI